MVNQFCPPDREGSCGYLSTLIEASPSGVVRRRWHSPK